MGGQSADAGMPDAEPVECSRLGLGFGRIFASGDGGFQPFKRTVTIVRAAPDPDDGDALHIEFVDQEADLDAGATGDGFTFAIGIKLPADLLRPGDRVEIDYATPYFSYAGNGETLIITRGGELVLFAIRTQPQTVDDHLLPELERFGVVLSHGGTSCGEDDTGSCAYRHYSLRAALRGKAATTLSADGLFHVDELSVRGSLSKQRTPGFCDLFPWALNAAGFMARKP